MKEFVGRIAAEFSLTQVDGAQTHVVLCQGIPEIPKRPDSEWKHRPYLCFYPDGAFKTATVLLSSFPIRLPEKLLTWHKFSALLLHSVRDHSKHVHLIDHSYLLFSFKVNSFLIKVYLAS